MAKRAGRRHARIGELTPNLGPYEAFNLGVGRDYAPHRVKSSSGYLTALAELEPAKTIQANLPRAAAAPATKIWLPTLWGRDGGKTKRNGQEEPLGLRYVPFVIGRSKKLKDDDDDPPRMRRRLLDGLDQTRVRRYLRSVDIEKSRFRVGLPVAAEAMRPLIVLEPTAPNWQPDAGLRGRVGEEKRITIFAVIDDGLPFAHRNFRDASGEHTRVEFCWLQSAKADTQDSVLFGREYTRADIEDHIKKYGDDEDVLYRMAGATEDTEGLASMIGRHATHGAHVMDLATGYAPERGETPAEEIRIIGVQLPNVVTMDTSGVGKDMYLLSAFHYIFHRADLIAKGYGIDRPRLVINFSYGYFGGPHDGQFDIEAAIGDLIKRRREIAGPTALVLPAGNSLLDCMHASIPDSKFVRGQASIRWRLQPADRTPNFVELWFPRDFDADGYGVELLDPSGDGHGELHIGIARGRQGPVLRLLNEDGKPIGQMSVDRHQVSLDGRMADRWRVLIAMVPSEPERRRCPGVEAGAWTIVIRRKRTAKHLGRESVRCWIQRDTDPASLRSGARQSYFDDPDNVRYSIYGSPLEVDSYPAHVRRFGSLNGLATSEHSLAVAGFRLGAGLASRAQDALPVPYSCAGTQNAGWPEARVTCSSMSDRSKALPGTVAAGVRSGSRSVMQGTSMAAPFVARQLATTFVSASDQDVAQAERENYRALLRGEVLVRRRSLRKDRLGEVLVFPHWQPGLER
jgi:hypothetical protein